MGGVFLKRDDLCSFEDIKAVESLLVQRSVRYNNSLEEQKDGVEEEEEEGYRIQQANSSS
jgi:hypothetical protein